MDLTQGCMTPVPVSTDLSRVDSTNVNAPHLTRQNTAIHDGGHTPHTGDRRQTGPAYGRHLPAPRGTRASPSSPRGIVLSQNAVSRAKPAHEPPTPVSRPRQVRTMQTQRRGQSHGPRQRRRPAGHTWRPPRASRLTAARTALRSLAPAAPPRPTAKRALDLTLGSALLVLAAPSSPRPP